MQIVNFKRAAFSTDLVLPPASSGDTRGDASAIALDSDLTVGARATVSDVSLGVAPVGPSTSVASANDAACAPSVAAAESVGSAHSSAACNPAGCPACGQRPNPLVSAGVIPEGLANILLPPKFLKKPSPRKQLPLPARVITSDEYVVLLEEKLAKEKEKEEKKRAR